MTDYVKSTNFASKDTLASGNPLKIVKGTEIDTEFSNIATAVATKADLNSPTFSGTPSLPTGTTAVTQATGDSSLKLSTTAFVQTALQIIYPVGSVYINASVSTNPAALLGFGTWTAFGTGRVLVGYDSTDSSFNSLGATGGSKNATLVSHTHTATVTDPTHTHTNKWTYYEGGGGSGLVDPVNPSSSGAYNANNIGYSSTGITVSNSTEGSSATNANLPPYITVYMWKRTA